LGRPVHKQNLRRLQQVLAKNLSVIRVASIAWDRRALCFRAAAQPAAKGDALASGQAKGDQTTATVSRSTGYSVSGSTSGSRCRGVLMWNCRSADAKPSLRLLLPGSGIRQTPTCKKNADQNRGEQPRKIGSRPSQIRAADRTALVKHSQAMHRQRTPAAEIRQCSRSCSSGLGVRIIACALRAVDQRCARGKRPSPAMRRATPILLTCVLNNALRLMSSANVPSISTPAGSSGRGLH